MEIRNVALLGAGAVGAYFIWGLSEELGDDFCVIAKGDRKKRLKEEGLIINGKNYQLNVKEPEEAEKIDLLLVASKQDALYEALDDIKALVSKNTIVISLLNGVSSEEIIGNTIGAEHMVYSFMRIASVRKGNEIIFTPEITAGVFIGEKDYMEPTERTDAIINLFKNTKIRCTYVKDIITDMWFKYAGNVSQNLPQAIIGVGFHAYIDSTHLYQIAEKLWKEVAAVANAKGVPLTSECQLFYGAKPDSRFSTLQDIDAKRHTEIEMLAGEMIRMGKECNISVPYCEYTYHLIKAIEEKNDGKFLYKS